MCCRIITPRAPPGSLCAGLRIDPVAGGQGSWKHTTAAPLRASSTVRCGCRFGGALALFQGCCWPRRSLVEKDKYDDDQHRHMNGGAAAACFQPPLPPRGESILKAVHCVVHGQQDKGNRNLYNCRSAEAQTKHQGRASFCAAVDHWAHRKNDEGAQHCNGGELRERRARFRDCCELVVQSEDGSTVNADFLYS